ncbi:MAG: pyruvate formate-lyase-activating protein [Actinomycetota bacterium]
MTALANRAAGAAGACPAGETRLARGSLHSWDISTGVDGPGTRFVVFTAGCPLQCLYCHNPDTWRMRNGEWVGSDEVLQRLSRYAEVLRIAGGGVTVTGGEPLLQPAFVRGILTGAKQLGLHTALDTSGVLGDRADAELLDATDLVLLDIKALTPALYRRLTGGALLPTLRFAERLAELGKPVWVRFVLLPQWTDDPGHVRSLAKYVAALGNVERVDVLGYHRLGREKYAELGLPDRLAGVPAATLEQVEDARAVFRSVGLHVT